MDEVKEIEWSDAVVARFWAYWSRRPHTYFAESTGSALLRRFRPYLDQAGLVIDYGCGSGGLVKALLGGGYRVLAVDFSAESVAAVAGRFSGSAGFAGAVRIDELGSERDASADAVFLVEAIEHMNDERLGECLARIHRLLKPGGNFIVTTPNREDIEAAKIYCPCCSTVFHPMQHQRNWSAASLARCLEAAGFKMVRTLETDLGADSPRPLLPYLIRLAKKALRRIDRDPHLCAVAVKV